VESEPSEHGLDGAPPPRGTLAEQPLAVLYAHAVDHRLSGSLALMPPSGGAGTDADVIVFADGAPVRVRTRKLVAPLGEMLVRLGVIADVDLEAALSRASTAQSRIGRQLVSDRLIDRRLLLRALREQVLVRLRSLGDLPADTGYEFHSQTDLLEEGAPTNATPCDPLAGLLALCRTFAVGAGVDVSRAELAARADELVRIRRDATLDRFDFDEQERVLVARIQEGRPLPFAAYGSGAVVPERVAVALLYALVLARQLEDPRTEEPPLDADAVAPGAASLRDSSLGRGVDPLRSSQVMRVLGAADDHREALALLRSGDLEAARALAARAAERTPANGEYRTLHGYLTGLAGDPQAGVAVLDEVIRADARNDRALVYRAKLLEELGKSKAARADLDAALEVRPQSSEARAALRALRRPELETPRKEAWQWLALGLLLGATVALLAVYLSRTLGR